MRAPGEVSKVTAQSGPCSLLRFQLAVTYTVSLKSVLQTNRSLSEEPAQQRW